MNIIQIGERYVNMDNIVTFKIQFNTSSDWFEFNARTNNGENISIDITEEEANVLKSEFRKKLLLSSEVKKNKSIICVDCRYDFLANIDDCTLIGDNYWCRCPSCRGLNKFEEEEEPKDICTGHLCGICDKFSILRADGEHYQYGCALYNKVIPAIGAVRDIKPKDFKEEK